MKEYRLVEDEPDLTPVPEPESMPWAPEGGGWVEREGEGIPADLDPSERIEILLQEERETLRYYAFHRPASEWEWESQGTARIVAWRRVTRQ